MSTTTHQVLHIGFEAKRAFFNYRGLGTYSRLLLTGLGTYFPEHRYSLFTPKIPEHHPFTDVSRYPSFSIRGPEGIYQLLPGQCWRSFGVNRQLSPLDLYHGLSHELPLFTGSHRGKTKFIVTIHDLIYLTHPELFPWIDRKIYDFKFRHACHRADHIIAVSEKTKNEIVELFQVNAEKISVCYQTCDPRFYLPPDLLKNAELKNQLNIADHYLFSLGAFERRKNFHRLIEAYALIPKSLRIPLIIAGQGEGEYLQLMRRIISKKQLENEVKIFVGLSRETTIALYQGATLFAFPSLLEGFGIPNIEALFSGIPVLTSQRPELQESTGPGGVYVDPEEIESMTLGLTKLLENAKLRNQLAMDGREYVQRFHQQQTTQRLMNCYLSVLNRSPQSS